MQLNAHATYGLSELNSGIFRWNNSANCLLLARRGLRNPTFRSGGPVHNSDSEAPGAAFPSSSSCSPFPLTSEGNSLLVILFVASLWMLAVSVFGVESHAEPSRALRAPEYSEYSSTPRYYCFVLAGQAGCG